MTKIRAWPTYDGKPTTVIAHRGASGTLPEHTIEAYALAIEQGAEVIEPDLVITKDGVLVARHDRGLARSTEVARHKEFADRRRTLPDGTVDWYVDDFTWDELSTLHAVQPFPGRSKEHDGRYRIRRFEDVLDLAEREGRRLGRSIGVYPEIKNPSDFEAAGHDITAAVIHVLKDRGVRGTDAFVWVQCFERPPLERVHAALGVPVYELFEYERAGPDFVSALRERTAKFLSGVAVDKRALVKPDLSPSGLVEAAHELHLRVHAWTFRDDQLPKGLTAQAEYELVFRLGVDALFSDFPKTALAVRDEFVPP